MILHGCTFLLKELHSLRYYVKVESLNKKNLEFELKLEFEFNRIFFYFFFIK